MFVRIVRELRHGDEAVGGTELDAMIVRTEVLDVAEAVSREQHTEFFTLFMSPSRSLTHWALRRTDGCWLQGQVSS